MRRSVRRGITALATMAAAVGTPIAFVVATAAPAAATTFTVTDLADGPANAADCPGASCSVRDAFAAASAAGDDEIVLSPGATYQITHCDAVTGQGIVANNSDTITVFGNGATIENACAAAANTRVLQMVGATSTLVLADVTITGGNPTTGGGGILSGGGSSTVELVNATISGNSAGAGAGIDGGTVVVTNSTISENTAVSSGGGISSFGPVTVTNSTIAENTAGGNGGGGIEADSVSISGSVVIGNRSISSSGGGIDQNDPDFTLVVTNSTIADNRAEGGGSGGGLDADGDATITNSTVSGNFAGDTGGGLRAAAQVTVTASTFSGNATEGDTGGGGAIEAGARNLLELVNSTVHANTAGAQFGGGILADQTTLRYSTVTSNTASAGGANLALGSGAFTSFASVIAQPVGTTNCFFLAAVPASQGYNFSDDTSCGLAGATDTQAGAPVLGALAANGGPTNTRLPLAGSPLLDKIPAASPCAGVNIVVDQRGLPRPVTAGQFCDIGAVEVQTVRVTAAFTG